MTGGGLRTTGDERRLEGSDAEMATAAVVRWDSIPPLESPLKKDIPARR